MGGVARSIELDPTQVTRVRVFGRTVYVEDDTSVQAVSISARDLDAFRGFVTGLVDALGTLTAVDGEHDALASLDWRETA